MTTLDAGRDLFGALLWRARREGVRLLFAPIGFLVLAALIETGVPLLTGSGDTNNRGQIDEYARQFGVEAHAATVVGIVLQTGPAQLALFLSLGAAVVIRNFVGSEAGRGALEAMLASRYSPQSLVAGVLAFTATLLALLWVVMGVLVVAWLEITAVLAGTQVRLTAAYLVLLLVVPLLAAWCGGVACLTLSMLSPRLVQQGQLGIGGSGNLASGIAIVPALVLLALQATGAALDVAAVVTFSAVGFVALTALGLLLVSRRFRPEGVLEA